MTQLQFEPLQFEPSLTSDPFLKEFQREMSFYTKNYLKEYNDVSRHLKELILSEEDDITRNDAKGLEERRYRRQIVSPDISSLKNGYSQFFGNPNRRNDYKSRTKMKKKDTKKKKPTMDDDMPIVLVPQEDETECVANNQLSSFGFLGFILNIVNAVINVANNINNNNRDNNDNNNNNNNNDGNVNTVGITQTATNTNDVMAMAGRRLDRLRKMRHEVKGHMRAVQEYKKSRRIQRSTSPGTCGTRDVVDEALLTSVALIDMWKEVQFEVEPSCMALEFCQTSAKLNQFSRLAAMMADVASVAAAHMLKNFQGVNPDYLIHAAEQGVKGTNCTQLYLECHHYDAN